MIHTPVFARPLLFAFGWGVRARQAVGPERRLTVIAGNGFNGQAAPVTCLALPPDAARERGDADCLRRRLPCLRERAERGPQTNPGPEAFSPTAWSARAPRSALALEGFLTPTHHSLFYAPRYARRIVLYPSVA